MGPQNLALQVQEVRERVARAAAAAGRSAHSVTLLAAGKAQPLALLRAAAEAGFSDFGESYLNEALPKLAALQDRALTWHYIGRLQANKTRPVAEAFAWVHAVDRLRVAERLSAQRPYHAPPLNVCLQVNLAGEASKGGVPAAQLAPLAAAVAALPRLKLRGLMCLPPQESDPARQLTGSAQLHIQEELNAGGAASTPPLGMAMTSRRPSPRARPSCASGRCCSAQDPYNSAAMSTRRLCILGAGSMGRALISGLLRSGTRAELLSVGESVPAARELLARELAVSATADNAAAIAALRSSCSL
jgi:pyridoxal phosphate enzyme (YggS family)